MKKFKCNATEITKYEVMIEAKTKTEARRKLDYMMAVPSYIVDRDVIDVTIIENKS